MEKPQINAFNTIAPLIVQKYERYLPTAFDDDLSILQKVNQIITNLEQIGVVTNEVVTQWNTVMEWVMNDGLTESVQVELDAMANNGTLTRLLNMDILNQKMNRGEKISVTQIDKNLGLIDETYLSETLKAQMAGTTPIGASVADKSIVTRKIADRAVDFTVLSDEVYSNKLGHRGKATYSSTVLFDYVFDLLPNVPVIGQEVRVKYKLFSEDSNIKEIYTTIFLNNDITPGKPLGGNTGLATTSNLQTFVKPYATYDVVKGTLPTDAYQYAHVHVAITQHDKTKPVEFNVTDLELYLAGVKVSQIGLPKFYSAITNSEVQNNIYMPNTLMTRKNVELILSNNEVSKWSNKTIVFIGDSLTANLAGSKKYHDFIRDKINCSVVNSGISGSGYVVSSQGNSALYQRLDSIPDGDLISVFMGTNDWWRNDVTNVPLGVYGDTTSATFYGILDSTYQQLIDKYVSKTIAIITPIQRNNIDSLNFDGKSLEQYVDAIIKVANKYSLPVLDLYRNGNIYGRNATFVSQFMPDGLHPNDAGHEKLASKILSFYETL